jgi:hypothetical protein
MGEARLTCSSVITLTLLPSLVKPRSVQSVPLSTSDSSSSLDSLDVSTSASLLGSLVTCLASEFEGLFRWDLRMNTVVEFNEVGESHVSCPDDFGARCATHLPCRVSADRSQVKQPISAIS